MQPPASKAPAKTTSSFKKLLPVALSAASLLMVAPVPSAQAATTYVPSFSFDPPTSWTPPAPSFPSYADNYVLGYHFITDIDRTIKGIGIYNTISTPLNNSLAIWNWTLNKVTPIFQTFLTSKGDCTGDYCWLPASSFTGLPVLKPTNDYVIAVAWPKNDPVPTGIDTTNFMLKYPGFEVLDNAYNFTSPLTNLNADLANFPPNETNTADKKSFLTANLSFETFDTVQTPAPLPLIGLGAALGWSRKIRRRINLSS